MSLSAATLRQMLRSHLLLSAVVSAAAVPELHRQLQDKSARTTLVTFDGARGTTHHWVDMNDPVMGGRSHSDFRVTDDDVLAFQGTCAIVPFLHAPGFAKIYTADARSSGRLLTPFPDVSKHFSGALHLRVRTTTPQYSGFKVAFGADGARRPTPSRHGGSSFKADFPPLTGTDWQEIAIPFNQFSIDWSEYTGECTTRDPTGQQHYCCSAAHPEVCPTAAHLRSINSVEVWAEGVEGTFTLDIDWIAAGPLGH